MNWTRYRLVAVVSALALLNALSACAGEVPRKVMVPMRDGTQLAA